MAEYGHTPEIQSPVSYELSADSIHWKETRHFALILVEIKNELLDTFYNL